MNADDSRHDSTGADPRQGDLLELLAATETEDQQYRDARRRRLREAGHGKPADSDAARQGRGRETIGHRNGARETVMGSEVEGFSDTGMIVFGATLGGLALVIVVASFLTLLFARRHRFLKSCGVFLGGSVIATPIFIVAAFIAMYV